VVLPEANEEGHGWKLTL